MSKPGTMQERAAEAAREWERGAVLLVCPLRELLERFAAAEVAEAVRAEREACAMIADKECSVTIRDAIRARSKT